MLGAEFEMEITKVGDVNDLNYVVEGHDSLPLVEYNFCNQPDIC